MNSEVYNLPRIRRLKDLEEYFPSVEIISSYNTYEKFDEFYYKIYYAICACFEIPECQQFRMKFKFYPDDTETYELSLPKMILNLNCWRPLIELNKIQNYYVQQIRIMDSTYIVSSMMSKTLRMNLETKVLKILNDYGISFKRSSALVKTVIERYQALSIEFALIDQAAIMTFENIFLNDYMLNEKVRELNNLVISDEIQTSDVDKMIDKKMKELVNEMALTKNPIWYISKTGKAVKDRQLQELFISYGQIPDYNGIVIPYTMKGNGFSTGYTDIPTYYIAATGARLSAIMNKEQMGMAGYLGRNLVLMSRTLTLSNHIYDCGTKHMLKVFVKNHEFLKRLENKWFCEHEGEPLQLIHYDDHKHLIGKSIWIRSLVTCAGGDEVCHVCYGNDSHLVMNMPGMGTFNTEIYSSVISQNILSTKHLLATNANIIYFRDSFDKYFKFISGDIYLKDEEEIDLPENDSFTIRIPEENVIPVNESDLIEYNTFGNNINSPLFIYHKNSKTYEKITIENYSSMFIDANSMKYFTIVSDRKQQKRYFEIQPEVLSSELEGRLLSIDIKNNGLTDHLKNIIKFVNKDAPQFDDYNQFAQAMFELLMNANINCRHVQGEVILNRLVRDANNLAKRPDFKRFDIPPYKIINLSQALLKYGSPTISLSFQEIKRQLLSQDFYDKDGESYLDPLYATEISTKRYREAVQKRLEQMKNGQSK